MCCSNADLVSWLMKLQHSLHSVPQDGTYDICVTPGSQDGLCKVSTVSVIQYTHLFSYFVAPSITPHLTLHFIRLYFYLIGFYHDKISYQKWFIVVHNIVIVHHETIACRCDCRAKCQMAFLPIAMSSIGCHHSSCITEWAGHIFREWLKLCQKNFV